LKLGSDPDGRGSEGKSRRELIRMMVLSAVGIGMAAATSIPLFEIKPVSGKATASQSVPITVKVVYFQMPQLVENHQEYFVLQSPAIFGELLEQVTRAHPVLASMTQSMMILVNGSVAKSNTPLNGGDEVDFIPAFAGG